ncbi:MAG: DUF6940 family protein [Bacteroidota bacterium]
MLTHQATPLEHAEAYHYSLYYNQQPLSYGSFLKRLENDPDFRSDFIHLLKKIPYPAFHWETPPLAISSLDQPFEFVTTNSPSIDLRPDPAPFHSYIQRAPSQAMVTDFPNLGGDAQLIIPLPKADRPDLNYAHIGVFTEQAPLEQQHELWQAVGRMTREQLSERPIWLNTAGGGVAWLHIRLDSRPKYYLHSPYRQQSG